MIVKDFPLNTVCTYKTGGNAEYFCDAASEDDIKEALKFAQDNRLELILLGGGYNVLVADSGVKGLVLCTAGLNSYILKKDDSIYAGAGVTIDKLAEWTCENGLAGFAELSGIPGTVGGAVRMNAGAFTTEIKDVALSVDVMSLDGVTLTIKAADAGFGYRKAENIKGIILGADFRAEKGCAEELKHRRCEILAKRAEKQPLDYPSCGSVFKRPEGNYAGTLIEKCGLKGYSIGGAEVSDKHANFILNKGNATSNDIYSLMCHVRDTVEQKTGIRLEMEVRLIGF